VRLICSIAVVTLLVGCQSTGSGGAATPTNRPGNQASSQPTTKAPAQTSPPSQAATSQAEIGWTPDWWIDKPARVSGGAVQASGTATAGDLREARRQAIDTARAAALTLADAGQRERVVQAATNPNANGSYTVWVVLELGGL